MTTGSGTSMAPRTTTRAVRGVAALVGIAVGASLLVAAPPASATWPPLVPLAGWTADEPITPEGAEVLQTATASNANGDAVLVYSALVAGEGIRAVYAQRRTSDSVWAPAERVSAPGRDAYVPRVAMNRLGRICAAWQVPLGTTSEVEVACQTPDDAWTGPLVVPTGDTDVVALGDVAIADQGTGAVIVSAIDTDTGTTTVQGHVLGLNAAWTSAVDFQQGGAGDFADLDIVGMDDGGFVAAWRAPAAIRSAAYSEGAWSATDDVSVAGSMSGLFLVSSGYAATATWIRTSGGRTSIMARQRTYEWQPETRVKEALNPGWVTALPGEYGVVTWAWLEKPASGPTQFHVGRIQGDSDTARTALLFSNRMTTRYISLAQDEDGVIRAAFRRGRYQNEAVYSFGFWLYGEEFDHNTPNVIRALGPEPITDVALVATGGAIGAVWREGTQVWGSDIVPAPKAPRDLTARADGPRTITLKWIKPVSGTPTGGYVVQWRYVSPTNWSWNDLTQTSSTTFTWRQADSDTRYEFRVYARNLTSPDEPYGVRGPNSNRARATAS